MCALVGGLVRWSQDKQLERLDGYRLMAGVEDRGKIKSTDKTNVFICDKHNNRILSGKPISENKY